MQVAAFFCRALVKVAEHEYQIQAGAVGVFLRSYLPLEVDVAVLLTGSVDSPESQYLSFDLVDQDGVVRRNAMKARRLSNGAIESQQIVPMKLTLPADIALGRHELRLSLDGQSAFVLPFEVEP